MKTNNFISNFHPQKAITVISKFLELHKRPIELLTLANLIYKLELESFNEMGYSVTRDSFANLKGVFIPFNTYYLLSGEETVEDVLPLWEQHIQLSVTFYRDNTPPLKEIRLLKPVFNKYLCELHETFIQKVYCEWQKEGGENIKIEQHLNCDIPIPVSTKDILTLLGKTEDEILEIANTIARENYLDKKLVLLDENPIPDEIHFNWTLKRRDIERFTNLSDYTWKEIVTSLQRNLPYEELAKAAYEGYISNYWRTLYRKL